VKSSLLSILSSEILRSEWKFPIVRSLNTSGYVRIDTELLRLRFFLQYRHNVLPFFSNACLIVRVGSTLQHTAVHDVCVKFCNPAPSIQKYMIFVVISISLHGRFRKFYGTRLPRTFFWRQEQRYFGPFVLPYKCTFYKFNFTYYDRDKSHPFPDIWIVLVAGRIASRHF
jgi:hypothetical protein